MYVSTQGLLSSPALNLQIGEELMILGSQGKMVSFSLPTLCLPLSGS